MLIVLSPAKRLVDLPVPEVDPSVPALKEDAESLVKSVRRLSRPKLKALMHLSLALTELNHRRFQQFRLPIGPEEGEPAIYRFGGDTYVGFDAPSVPAEDLEWAQDRLAILSGLYGVLRPLDRIQPYRLEMGSKLSTRRGRDLYAFWKGRIADRINELTEGHEDRTVVNLASGEYFTAVRRGRLAGPVVTPVFQDVKDGKARVLGLFAKKARGAMAAWAVRQRLERPERLRGFEGMGYRFQPELSDDETFVFQRPQPPPVG